MVRTAFGQALLKVDAEGAVRELRKGFELDAGLKNRKGVGMVAPILIETLVKLGRVDEAREVFRRALAIAPGDRRILRWKTEIDPDSA